MGMFLILFRMHYPTWSCFVHKWHVFHDGTNQPRNPRNQQTNKTMKPSKHAKKHLSKNCKVIYTTLGEEVKSRNRDWSTLYSSALMLTRGPMCRTIPKEPLNWSHKWSFPTGWWLERQLPGAYELIFLTSRYIIASSLPGGRNKFMKIIHLLVIPLPLWKHLKTTRAPPKPWYNNSFFQKKSIDHGHFLWI